MRLLLIEDDLEAANWLLKGLSSLGHETDHAANGVDGLALARSGDYDVLVVDRMLPGRSGLSIIRTLHAEGDFTPALILSALGKVEDRVKGLYAGGDDYLVKPFDFDELVARLEVLSRRRRIQMPADELAVHDLRLDLTTHRVTRAGREIRLQPRELQLLEYLMRHQGKIVTRKMLLEHVWHFHFDPRTTIVDTQISRLRSKIDKGFESTLIHTIRGRGFRLGVNE